MKGMKPDQRMWGRCIENDAGLTGCKGAAQLIQRTSRS